MKWIGQNIYDLASRFRNDVFLEDIASGTIASGAHLGLDSNNKIVKAVDGGGDLTSIVAGTGLSGTDLTGPIPTLNVDASQTHITGVGTITAGVWRGTAIESDSLDADTAHLTTDQTFTGSKTFSNDTTTLTSANANDPLLLVQNTANDATSGRIRFLNNRGADGQDGDSAGMIQFYSYDDGTPSAHQYGRIQTKIDVAASGQESGDMIFSVANHDGGVESGLTLTGGSVNAEVDVTIGTGAASVTTVAGTLTMGSTATINNSGVWVGGVIPSAKLDTDTAHLSGAQTFTGTKTLNSFKGTGGTTVTNILDEDAMGSNSATALATQQSIKAYANRPDSQVVMMRAGFKGDVTTTKYYIPLQAELEQTTFNHETNGFLAPFAGKLLKVMYRASGDLSGSSNSVTFRLEQVPRNAAWGTPTILETIAVDGPTNNTTDPNMAIASFVGGDGTNVFAAGDTIMVSLQHSADVSAGSTRHFFTLVFEMDYSGLA